MSGLQLVNAFDVFRSLGPNPLKATPQDVADWLSREYLNRGGGRFNYDPSIGCLSPGFAGAMSLGGALRKCESHWHPAGRRENKAVVNAIWSHVESNRSECHSRSFLAVPVGRIDDKVLFAGLKAPLIRVQHNEVLLVLPAFRRGFRPSERQLDAILTFARAQTVREGYPDIDVECLYAGPEGRRGRAFRVFRGSERALFTDNQLDAMLQTYATGAGLLMRSGVGQDAPDFRGYRVIDPDQPSMF